MKLLTEKQVSEITGIARQTLKNHRHNGTGLPFVCVGKRSIRYRESDVLEAIHSGKIQTRLVVK